MKPGSAAIEKRKLPALESQWGNSAGVTVVPPVRGHTPEDRGTAEAERDRGGDHRRGETAARFRIAVEYQREARRLRRALADADPESREGEQREPLRGGRQPRRQRPECQRDREQPRSHPAIRQSPERQREQGVEEREHRAVQQAHLGIADVEIVLDPRRQDGKDVAIEQADGVGERHQCEGIAGRVREARAAHSLNQRSALVCISFFLVASGMSRLSWVRTSSAWN